MRGDSMKELVRSIVCSICKSLSEECEEPQLPKIKTYSVPWYHIKQYLVNQGLECMIKDKYAGDNMISLPTLAGLKKMTPYLVFPAQNVGEGCDCDDYAKMASATASFKFKVSGYFQVWGEMPLGGHAWNLAVYISFNDDGIAQFGHFYCEPNAGFVYAGELFSEGEHGYMGKSFK